MASVLRTGAVGAAAGTVIGAAVVGAPVLMAVAGLGGGLYAASKSEHARNAGDAMALASSKTFRAAVDFNAQHDITGKVGSAGGVAWQGTMAAASAAATAGKAIGDTFGSLTNKKGGAQ